MKSDFFGGYGGGLGFENKLLCLATKLVDLSYGAELLLSAPLFQFQHEPYPKNPGGRVKVSH